eukprot:5551616-Amphidinium_carterae.1
MRGHVCAWREVFVLQPDPKGASGVVLSHASLHKLKGPDGPERGVKDHHAHAKEQRGSDCRNLRGRG